jgi:hypothetical protein
MATVQLGRYECENGKLPRVCMRCGAAAEEFVSKDFSWHPSLLPGILFFGMLFLSFALLLPRDMAISFIIILSLPLLVMGLIVVAYGFNCRMIVLAPLCTVHRRHWSNRHLFDYLFIIVLLCSVPSLVIVTASNALPQQLMDQFSRMVGLGLVLAAVVWAIVGVAWDFRLIRPRHLDDNSITLTGVAPAFVAAVNRKEENRWG